MNIFLGIKINYEPNRVINMSWPQLIDSILKNIGLLDEQGRQHVKTSTKDLPSVVWQKVTADTNGKDFHSSWNYQSVIGKLYYLEKSTHPDTFLVFRQLTFLITELLYYVAAHMKLYHNLDEVVLNCVLILELMKLAFKAFWKDKSICCFLLCAKSKQYHSCKLLLFLFCNVRYLVTMFGKIK